MDSVDQTAKTVDEAVALALEKLDTTRNGVEVAILEVTRKSGLLGFLGQPSATVRVTRKRQPPAEPPAAAAVAVESSQPTEEPQPTVEEWAPASADSDYAPITEGEVASEGETDQITEGPGQEASELAEQARSLVQEIVVKMDL
ncbi:MAG: Jag N-terminal domain-containing protein, partial [Armatimonadetes bacterium]|nr:Jag N-terminal domain-containing protein [Armatimonadota bacterium]